MIKTEKKIIIPPIKIQGIKSKIVPEIQNNLTWNKEGKWIEPFLGSGVVLFNIQPNTAVLSDTNPHIINFYNSLKTYKITPSLVRNYLQENGSELLKKGSDYYYHIRERFNNKPNSLDFLFLNRSCFNGLMRFNGKGRFNTPFCKKDNRFSKSYITKITNQVSNIQEIMLNKDWTFMCVDWKYVVKEISKNDFIYFDPPYITRHAEYYNKWNLNEAELLEKKIKKLPCKFIYSMWAENKYRKNSSLTDVFSDFKIQYIEHFYHIGSKENYRNKMKEAIVIG